MAKINFEQSKHGIAYDITKNTKQVEMENLYQSWRAFEYQCPTVKQ